MADHYWGDEDFDWEALHQAGTFIAHYCKTRAWLVLHWKEKYGTLRYEFLTSTLFSQHTPIHSLWRPGHLYYRYSIRCRKIDEFIGRILWSLGITKLVQKYQLFILRRAVELAKQKYPHIADEITDDLDDIMYYL